MADTDPAKTKEELEAEQQAAKDQLQTILDSSRPKHLGYGITSGVSNIVAGAVGGAGVLVLAPVMGTTVGAKKAGIMGGAVGLVGGAVVGAVGGVAVAVGGTVQGVTQVVRGAVATPGAIMEPTRGKWWNDVEGKWILTKLDDERKAMIDIPEDDDDILGEAKKDAADSTKPPGTVTASKVADTAYYDVLEVAPDVETSKLKRQYYILARKYHPDRVGTNDKESADKFKDIAEAYQVLSDPELRHKYDVEGKEGLSPDKTDVADGPAQADPAMLFAFLFGSDKFGDYVGRLAMATSALVADSPKISPKDARIVQQRRVTRLAIKLAERLQIWTEEDYDGAKAIWESTATDLGQASYGTELVILIGKIYSLSAHQFLGATDSGVGMPSIAKWAKGHYAKMEKTADTNKAKRDGLMAGMKMMTLQQKAEQELAAAKTEEERKAKQAELEQAQVWGMLNVMWTTTVVDISTTLHEAAQMVLHDQSVDKDTRKRRAYGLKHIGEIFMACKAPLESGQPEDAKKLYEEAAFAAMLETIKRKEEAAQAANAH
mmetsp:Transcript_39536/g.83122  ORF Transcript_39536/g.83122 Transcript_39536/m.83122 type:complete len:546 (-) Transcript_39536:70-1707(-)|eukprot:CAMPEP_0183711266 /NCGR_PEP_ID=MMETSP0737-20130205/6812_1 /TAXON_ID=385413 /ORGANISM="Thalassiosira miniscula, Strain CCMP1093" /LENGTH=545 /DNA_ID=CAMNT_0025939735 /DNA_START=121 /DNA_END=1758 /DNA_ORIENTATION=+